MKKKTNKNLGKKQEKAARKQEEAKRKLEEEKALKAYKLKKAEEFVETFFPLITSYIENHNIEGATSMLKDLEGHSAVDHLSDKQKLRILQSISVEYTPNEIRKILALCEINLGSTITTEVSVQGSVMNISSEQIMVDLALQHWRANPEKALEFLHFLKRSNLNFEPTLVETSPLISILMTHNNDIPYDFIQMLFNTKCIQGGTYGSDIYCPFNIAVSTTDVELITLLLNNGVDYSNFLQFMDNFFSRDGEPLPLPQLGIEKFSTLESNQFFLKINRLIKSHLLKKLTEAAAVKVTQSQEDEVVIIEEAIDSTPAGTEESAAAAEEETSSRAPSEKTAFAQTTFDSCLQECIEYQRHLTSIEAKTPEFSASSQGGFEDVVLQYMLTPEASTEQQINQLLATNDPKIYESYQEILFRVISSAENAEAIFSKPLSEKAYFKITKRLFNFQEQDAHAVSLVEEPVHEMVLAAGIHPLPGSPNIFMELSQDFIDSLPQELQRKLSTHLTDLVRISSSSENQTGVKLYPQNIAKIKFAGLNGGIFSTHHIKGTCEGQKVTIWQFNKFGNHNLEKHLLNTGGSYDETGDITPLIYMPPIILDTTTEGQDVTQDTVTMAGQPTDHSDIE